MNSQDRWQSSGERKGLSKKGVWIFLAIAAAAIVAFLIAAVPDHLCDSPIRSPVSRAHSDIRSIATAMEAYYVDAGAYPAWTTEPSLWIAFNPSVRLPSFRRRVDGGAMTLTTPTAFMTSFPLDPFRRDGEGDRTFAYWAPPEGGWILLSAGPDCVFDLDFETLKGVYVPTSYNPTLELIVGYTYDPTNGSESAGDIWRVKQ